MKLATIIILLAIIFLPLSTTRPIPGKKENADADLPFIRFNAHAQTKDFNVTVEFVGTPALGKKLHMVLVNRNAQGWKFMSNGHCH